MVKSRRWDAIGVGIATFGEAFRPNICAVTLKQTFLLSVCKLSAVLNRDSLPKQQAVGKYILILGVANAQGNLGVALSASLV